MMELIQDQLGQPKEKPKRETLKAGDIAQW